MLAKEDEGYARGAFESRVLRSGRGSDACDKGCLVLFLLSVAAYVGLTGYYMSNANVKSDLSDLDDVLIALMNKCVADRGGSPAGRLLASETVAGCTDMFCIMSRAYIVPVVMIGLSFVLAFLVLLGLYMVPQTITWASVAFNIACYMFIGIAIIMQANKTPGGDATVGYLFVAFGVGTLIISYVTRHKIIMAGRHLKTASLALAKNTSVFPAALILQILVVAFIVLFWFANDAASRNLQLNPITCGLERNSAVQYFFLFMFFWTTAWLKLAKLNMVAMTVGSWYFGQSDRVGGLGALTTTVTRSAPVITVASIICTIVDYIVAIATNRFWWLDPVGCVVKCIFLIFQSCVMALTKYAMIGHAFIGKGFFSSSKAAFAVLRRNAVGGYVNDVAGASVVFVVSKVLAILLGMAAWYWTDQIAGTETLAHILKNLSPFMVALFFLIWLYFVQIPVISIIVLVQIQSLISSFNLNNVSLIDIYVPMTAVFISCFCSMVLGFFGSLVLDAMSTVFFGYAVGRDTSKAASGDDGQAAVYALLDDNMKEDFVDAPTAVAVR
jgi:hypothetical protein